MIDHGPTALPSHPMITPSVRLLSDECALGSVNMARDEALLSVGTQPTIRLYTWSEPTLSLGYFQKYTDIMESLPASMSAVRRITGGGAIWHEHEVTYSILCFPGKDLPAGSAACYARLHGCILERLRQAGAHLGSQGNTVGDKTYHKELRCFASPAKDDIVHSEGGKVVGSAGRCRDDRMLIHGSLKLASNPWDQQVVAGCGLTTEIAREALLAGLIDAFNMPTISSNWTDEEEDSFQELHDIRYGTPDWVHNRSGPRP